MAAADEVRAALLEGQYRVDGDNTITVHLPGYYHRTGVWVHPGEETFRVEAGNYLVLVENPDIRFSFWSGAEGTGEEASVEEAK